MIDSCLIFGKNLLATTFFLKPNIMNQSFIHSIQTGGRERETALKNLYQDQHLRKLIFRFVDRQKGNPADAWDLYHDAIIVLDRKIRQKKVFAIENVSKYLYGISRLLWKNKVRSAARTQLTAEQHLLDEVFYHSPDLLCEEKEQKSQIEELYNCLDEKGGQVMSLWQASYSMREIANKLELSSEGLARKYKYRSHKKLLKIVAAQPLWEEWLA